MNRQRTQRLQLLVDIARRSEDDAARVLSEKRSAMNAAFARAQEIQEYYADYHAQFSARTAALRAADIMASRGFLAQLDGALKSQQHQCRLTQHEFERARATWRQCHLKHKAIMDYRDRCVIDDQQRDARYEQKLMDELSGLSKGRF